MIEKLHIAKERRNQNGLSEQVKIADDCLCFNVFYFPEPLAGKLVKRNDIEHEWDDEMCCRKEEVMRRSGSDVFRADCCDPEHGVTFKHQHAILL